MPATDPTRRAQAVATPEVIQAFARDGAVRLPGLLNADEVALLRGGIDANIAAPSPRAKVASRPDDPGFFIEDFCCWQDNEAYRRVITESPLAAAAGLLMHSRQVRLYHDHMLTKEPGTRQRTPWHQDQPYYNVEGRQNVSFWIPVDPVRRHSTLEFVAGSHLGPWLMPRTFMDSQAKWFPEGSLADLPDIEAARERFPIIGWPVASGAFSIKASTESVFLRSSAEWKKRRNGLAGAARRVAGLAATLAGGAALGFGDAAKLNPSCCP